MSGSMLTGDPYHLQYLGIGGTRDAIFPVVVLKNVVGVNTRSTGLRNKGLRYFP
jgi:hypothetical protein